MQETKILAVILTISILVSMLTVSISAKPQPTPDYIKNNFNPQFNVKVSPETRECKAGETVKFNIIVQAVIDEESKSSSFGQLVFLRIEGLPLEWVSKITPRYGRTNFISMLSIITSSESPPGIYNITVVGVSFGGVTSYSSLSINIKSESIKPGYTTSYPSGVDLSIRTHRSMYRIGEGVELLGSLSTNFGLPISNAKIYLLVMNPEGKIIYIDFPETNKLGTFYSFFALEGESSKFLNGTYIVYVTATAKDKIIRTHTTFSVEYSSYPSVQIDSVIILNSEGDESKSIFELGESLKIYVEITNYGIPLDSSMVWIEIQAPNRVPVKVMLTVQPLNTGESNEIVFDYKISPKARPGVYTVKVLISDKPISQGGRFIATGSETFIVKLS